MHSSMVNAYKILVGKCVETHPVGKCMGRTDSIVLKWVLKTWDVTIWIG